MDWKPKKYTLEQEILLPRERVWEILADTDKLNRMIGLMSVQFSDASTEQTLFFREALAKVGGVIPMRWKEYPFEWIKQEYYAVSREYFNGPLSFFYGGIRLVDSPEKLKDGSNATVVTLFAEFTPSSIIGLLAIPIVGVRSMKNTLDYLNMLVDYQGQLSQKYQSKLKIHVQHTLWTELEKELKSQPVRLDFIPLLRKHLFESGDQEVVGMSPFALAEKWNVNKAQILRLFLYATKVGILNLEWNIICPNCRVSKNSYNTLYDVKEDFHCDLCGVDYKANFDQYVELKFSVHPNIRKAVFDTYCVGGPMITPHIYVQKPIKQGAAIKLAIPSVEKLRIRILKKNQILSFQTREKKDDSKHLKVVYGSEGWEDSTIEIPKALSELIIYNASKEDVILALEETDWSKETVTAAKVTAMQEFRDLFSSEVLAPGNQIGIENVTIFFSDLRGSTLLYESIGDASAFGEVRKHFDFLHQWISKYSGAIVKTIGDAVMAVFYSPEDAVTAAIQIQKSVKEFNSVQENGIILKIGLHTGPAIAINSNDKLDYFGRTVNIAARIQNESSGGDIVISHDCYKRANVESLLKGYTFEVQDFEAKVKGVEKKLLLKRIVYDQSECKLRNGV